MEIPLAATPPTTTESWIVMILIDPDCLACVKCYRVIAAVGTGRWHLVAGGHGGVCCDECAAPAAS